MAKSLSERFKAALGANARAVDVAALIASLEIELAAAVAEQAKQHGIAIDVRSDDAVADEAADAETKAARRVTRLSAQIEQLRARLATITEAERQRAFAAERDAIVAERDALATDLKAEWPAIEAKMVSLLWRITASDARCRSVNVLSAEAEARGCGGSFSVGGMPALRLIEIHLPSFVPSVLGAAWPPSPADTNRAMVDHSFAAGMVAAAAERSRPLEPAHD